MFELFKIVLERDLKLYFRNKQELFNSVLFFLLVVILFPIGIGPQPEVLSAISFGVIWVAAIFASMFGIKYTFSEDHRDGTLTQYLLLPHNLEVILLAKITANWAAYSLPVVIIAPVAALMFNIDFSAIAVLLVTLLTATPIFALVGGIGAALSLGAKRGRVMLSLLVTPLYIPVLIFGVNTTYIFVDDLPGEYMPNILILVGLLLFSIPLSAFATSQAVRP